ncbi:MAG: GNAT family N-acetyltransferase [Pseudomonadales bacterium]
MKLCLPHGYDAEPMIRTIWPEPYATPAVEAFKADHATGQIFMIADGSTMIGLTGYFFEGSDPPLVYLRWTGVRPSYRRLGVGARALKLLVEHLREETWATKLVELVPDNEYGKPVEEFFLAQGFVRNDVPIPPNENSDWPCIAMTLSLQD